LEVLVAGGAMPVPAEGLVFCFHLYVVERDTYGIGFSDNVVFRKRYYVPLFPGENLEMYVHTGEKYLGGEQRLDQAEVRARATDDPRADIQAAKPVFGRPGQWTFGVVGTGFDATFRVGVGRDGQQ
jgi:hypothetical protein